MTLEAITLAICRCALIASPDNAALQQQIVRFHKHLTYTGNLSAAAKVYNMLHPSKNKKEPPLVHSTLGEKP
jgi:hypothetical protein